jgi:hypothetical protein
MKKVFLAAIGLMLGISSFGQVAYFQYRVVPNDRTQEFIQKETMYWSKVAATAIDKGQMTGWSLWRKVGITEEGAPNFVFVNNFESFDKIDQGAIWSADNVKTMGVSPEMVETQSFAPTSFDYWMQLEATAGGDYKYAVVNYAKPADLSGFIEENKTLWKPLHEKNINTGANKMTSWGMLSVVHPKGNQARFSAMTWDGFNSMADAMNYMSYTPPSATNADWNKVLSKTKMGTFMPDGFQYTILYELVMRIAPN